MKEVKLALVFLGRATAKSSTAELIYTDHVADCIGPRGECF
jgi:hypothetical protein